MGEKNQKKNNICGIQEIQISVPVSGVIFWNTAMPTRLPIVCGPFHAVTAK